MTVFWMFKGEWRLCASVSQSRTQKISEGRAKFHHNRVTSQINFRGSAESTTILGGSVDMPSGKFCKITPKNTHVCAFWKQVLDNTVYIFFYFSGLRGWPWHSGLPPPYVSGHSLIYVILLANTEKNVGPQSALSTDLRTLLKTRCIPER